MGNGRAKTKGAESSRVPDDENDKGDVVRVGGPLTAEAEGEGVRVKVAQALHCDLTRKGRQIRNLIET